MSPGTVGRGLRCSMSSFGACVDRCGDGRGSANGFTVAVRSLPWLTGSCDLGWVVSW